MLKPLSTGMNFCIIFCPQIYRPLNIIYFSIHSCQVVKNSLIGRGHRFNNSTNIDDSEVIYKPWTARPMEEVEITAYSGEV